LDSKNQLLCEATGFVFDAEWYRIFSFNVKSIFGQYC